MQPRPAADFRERVAPRDLPELMDGECTYEDFRACLVSLEQVNRWFLGYRPTIAEIMALLRWMESTAQIGNDLERSRRSSRLVGWVAKLVEWHRFMKHVGPVSFRRAFSKADWRRLLHGAGIQSFSVSLEPWRPGRLCVGKLPSC